MNVVLWILATIGGGIVYDCVFRRFLLPLAWGAIRAQSARVRSLPDAMQKRLITVFAAVLLAGGLWAVWMFMPELPHYDLSVEEMLLGERSALMRQFAIAQQRRIALKSEFLVIGVGSLAIAGFGAIYHFIVSRLDNRQRSAPKRLDRLGRSYDRFLAWAYGTTSGANKGILDKEHAQSAVNRSALGILAYGSLITDPGCEIRPLVVAKPEIVTPFRVEFARKSSKRGDAPTLIPVACGGSRVRANILILEDFVTEEAATHMLYRREIHEEGTAKKYPRRTNPKPNEVVIRRATNLDGWSGVALYTQIGSNIDDLTPSKLANLAINSARSDAGLDGKDGISYLHNAKAAGISTPLMAEYESEILRLLKADDLHDAIRKATARS